MARRKTTKKKAVKKRASVKIDTIPLPEKPIIFEIPQKYLEEFKGNLRVVIRHPWIVGIPVPHTLLRRDVRSKFKGADILLVPPMKLK